MKAEIGDKHYITEARSLCDELEEYIGGSIPCIQEARDIMHAIINLECNNGKARIVRKERTILLGTFLFSGTETTMECNRPMQYAIRQALYQELKGTMGQIEHFIKKLKK